MSPTHRSQRGADRGALPANTHRWVASLACLALAGCGPTVPLSANLKEAPVAIGFGSKQTPTPAPNAPQFPSILPNFPAPIEIPPPVFGASLPAPSLQPACNTDPAAATPPALAAVDAPTNRPSPATYNYRYTGTEVFYPGTSNSKTVTLPSTGTRQVTNVSAVASDGSYTFDVVETYAGRSVTTTYKVVPTGANAGPIPPPPPNPPIIGPPPSPPGPTLAPQNAAVQAGLYLVSMTTRSTEDGSTDTFQPTPGVLLMPFPAQPDLVYQGGGVDGANRESMSETPQGSSIQKQARVDACGNLVDSWQTVVQGTMAFASGTSAPAQNPFTLTLYIATQYGGISVGDHLVESGTDQLSGKPYTYDLTSNIDTVPAAPQAS